MLFAVLQCHWSLVVGAVIGLHWLRMSLVKRKSITAVATCALVCLLLELTFPPKCFLMRYHWVQDWDAWCWRSTSTYCLFFACSSKYIYLFIHTSLYLHHSNALYLYYSYSWTQTWNVRWKCVVYRETNLRETILVFNVRENKDTFYYICGFPD